MEKVQVEEEEEEEEGPVSLWTTMNGPPKLEVVKHWYSSSSSFSHARLFSNSSYGLFSPPPMRKLMVVETHFDWTLSLINVLGGTYRLVAFQRDSLVWNWNLNEDLYLIITSRSVTAFHGGDPVVVVVAVVVGVVFGDRTVTLSVVVVMVVLLTVTIPSRAL